MSGTGTLAGRTVLVTGSDGFIGSHVVEAVLEAGGSVRAFCFYNSQGSAGWLDQSPAFAEARVDGRASLVLGDVRDAEFVTGAVQGADVVLHLAALIAIPYSYVAPRSYVDTNITGTLNVLEAVRRTGVPRMVHTSTSEVYGTPETVPITETHPLRGQSPYSATKIAADKLCESFALSFGTAVVTLRPFNTFGPRQSARAVIPTVLSQLLAGADEIHLGSTSPRRDFTYVTDTARAFVSAAVADLEPGETVHLGTGTAWSIGEVVDRCMAVTGRQAEISTDSSRIRPANSEVQVLLSDPARALTRLGWQPLVDLDTGLAQTAAWLEPRVDAGTVHQYQR